MHRSSLFRFSPCLCLSLCSFDEIFAKQLSLKKINEERRRHSSLIGGKKRARERENKREGENDRDRLATTLLTTDYQEKVNVKASESYLQASRHQTNNVSTPSVFRRTETISIGRSLGLLRQWWGECSGKQCHGPQCWPPSVGCRRSCSSGCRLAQ